MIHDFDLNSNPILLIGSGRLAKHLTHWNSLNKQPNNLITWDRTQSFELLQHYLKKAKLVWLAITDSALVPFFENHLIKSDLPIVHFSGALSDTRLFGIHPLMTFPKELLDDSVYAKISFAVSELSDLQRLMPNFESSCFVVSESDKALYHALCVVAGNFPQLLWNEVDCHLSDLKIPESAFAIYIHQTVANFYKLRSKSLTGPLVRNDEVTLAKNTKALANTKLQSIYTAFVKEFAR